MQRRTVGKSQAHISLTKDSLSRMGGQDSEKPSRLNRRNLGVTNRIWIILSLVLSILLLTRYIIGSSSAPSAGGHRLLSSDLKPKNYLNATDLQHRESPFAFCPVYGEGDEVSKKYGALALTKTKLYLGSGARIQRVVNKAMSGLPVTISVIGGSGVFYLVSRFRAPKLHPPWHPLSGVVLHVWVYVRWILGIGPWPFLSRAKRADGSDGPCAGFALQCQPVMAQERTLYRQTVTHPSSSSGGTPSSRIPPRNSQMAQ